MTAFSGFYKKIVFLILAACGIGMAHVTAAQVAPRNLPRIGVISSTGTAERPWPLFEAFRSGLKDLGYSEGKNILIESRYAEGRLDRMPALVKELVEQKVDVILAVNNVVIRAAKDATKAIPIVMITSVDPVAVGYVESFGHPGGNITGLAHLGRDLSAKRVELLKEVLPKISRIAVLWDADGPGPAVAFKEYESAARAFKIDFRSLPVRGPNPELARVINDATTAHVDAVVVVANPMMAQHSKNVFELTTKHGLPTITEEGRFVSAGGLISYGASFYDLYRRAAGYVAEILKGAKPGDLPVKLPEKFEIFVNLKTAKEIGLVVPQHILVQADKIIK